MDAMPRGRFLSKEQLDNWQHRNRPTEDCVHTQQTWNDIYCDATYHDQRLITGSQHSLQSSWTAARSQSPPTSIP
nr:C-type lectin domain family 4 member F-like isoform X2 [Dasypus novemcinctus]